MSDFDRFRELVFEDASLRDRLLASTQLEPFLALVVTLARERGLTLTDAEVRSQYQAAMRAWIERQMQ